MKIYEIYEQKFNDSYHYVGWFEDLNSAIEFCRRQKTQCVVTKSNGDCTIEHSIIYKNY